MWDCKPDNKDDPINWVELKTSAEIANDKDMLKYERKLLKFWIQSFLLGVPKIIVGFRSKNGILQKLEELETKNIPGLVKRRGKGTWDGNLCINFTASFLDCRTLSLHGGSQLIMSRAQKYHNWRRRLAHRTQREIASDRSLQTRRVWPR